MIRMCKEALAQCTYLTRSLQHLALLQEGG